jgi:hypothetical protein
MDPIRAEIIKSISKRISEYEQSANELIYEYLNTRKPVPENIRKRYDNLGTLIDGLQEAIYIIHRGDLDV